MICVFPDPYPDELLFSVCARYSAIMQYPNKTQGVQDFFGKSFSRIVDLPGDINHLIRSLPPGHLYTADELIDKHTVFPFYAPYLAKGRAQLIREAMRTGESFDLATRILGTAWKGKTAIRLRFCPDCAQDDRKAFRVTYWHRLHQLYGVTTCAHHDVFLEDTEILWPTSGRPSDAKPADSYIRAVVTRRLDMTNPVHRIHRRIARIAFYLLNNSMDSIDSEVLAHRYRNLLLRNGLAHYNGQIRATKLINKIKESYPEELLPEIGCDIKTTRRVNRLVSTCQTKDIQHPIRHLLLLAYLDCQPEEIFDNFAEFKPFGHGPWPCLNPAVDHYKEPRILLCRVLPGAKKDRGKPRGVFACSCGFVYARLGPDALESDRFTYSIVQSYGPSWETLLRKLWPDKSYNIDTIANRLGVQIRTVKRRVVAFGLPIRRCDGESTKARIPNCYRLRRESKATLLKKKKEQILLVLAEKPEVDRSELWKIAYSQMIYIQRADPQWLRHHLPPPKQKYPCRPPLDWPSEDVLLAKAVKGAVAEIKDSEVLERVSIGSIIRRIDESGRLRKHLDKMPLTASILNSSLESKDNYLLRRIRWFEAAFRKEQIKPSRWGFIRRAAIRRDVTAANEAVRQAVDDALLRLNC